MRFTILRNSVRTSRTGGASGPLDEGNSITKYTPSQRDMDMMDAEEEKRREEKKKRLNPARVGAALL